jgi:acyl-coenzyme A thioesterase PaaI-like protein
MTAPTPRHFPPPPLHVQGAELLEAVDGRARVRFVPGPDAASPTWRVQGGYLAACLDEVIGPAVVSLGREGSSATVLMTVTFLGQAEPGQALLGEATVVHAGARHVLVEARLVRERNGAEVARASATSRPQDGGAS